MATDEPSDQATITPEQALANTLQLLETKQAQAREPQPWQALGGSTPDVPHTTGYQSDSAEAKAQALHEGEARLSANQGSSGTRDRIGQGKRDGRRGAE